MAGDQESQPAFGNRPSPSQAGMHTGESGKPAARRVRMRTALAAATRERDTVTVAVLRSVMGAIDNAEAIDASAGSHADPGFIAGAVAGLGATEVERRELTDHDVLAVVWAEITERTAAAGAYDALGRPPACRG